MQRPVTAVFGQRDADEENETPRQSFSPSAAVFFCALDRRGSVRTGGRKQSHFFRERARLPNKMPRLFHGKGLLSWEDYTKIKYK